MNAPFLKQGADAVYLSIKLQPRASRQRIAGVHGSELKVSVTSPPVDAAANRALIELLAEVLGVARGQIELISGQTSRHKRIAIRGISMEAVLKKLERVG